MNTAKIVKVQCHTCWQAPCEVDCCDVESRDIHDCDCEYCDIRKKELREISQGCDCKCHNPIPSPCPRCKNTRWIEYQARGNA